MQPSCFIGTVFNFTLYSVSHTPLVAISGFGFAIKKNLSLPVELQKATAGIDIYFLDYHPMCASVWEIVAEVFLLASGRKCCIPCQSLGYVLPKIEKKILKILFIVITSD